MSTRETLHTSDTALASLWAAVHAKRRADTTTLKVSPEELTALLKDHHTLVSALQSRKLLTIILTSDQESLTP